VQMRSAARVAEMVYRQPYLACDCNRFASQNPKEART
jgi:transposase